MRAVYSNFIEYQGISNIKKETAALEKITKKYFPQVDKLRENLHVYLE